MDKFGKSKNGNKYILVFIDVFTRRAYAIPMKTKSINDTSQALETFCENNFVPTVLNCNNDSSFMGREFQNVIKEHNILMIENDVENHRQLGVVDRFIQTLKNDIYKHFKFKNTTNWIDILPKILKSYNATPNNALDGIKPESAHLKDNAEIITQINLNKMMESRTNSQSQSQETYHVGDRVRKRVKVVIKNRSYNPNYSIEVFTIERINGSRIYLSGLMKPVVADQLQLIPKGSIEGNDDELKKAIKADKVRALIKEGIEADDKEEPIPIQRAKRQRNDVDYSKLLRILT
jgi:hypothetical protein